MTTVTGADATRATGDYLALVWKAYEWPDDRRRPDTTDPVAVLGVTPSVASASLKCLAREEMIKHRPYGNIGLAEEGGWIGRAVVRCRHVIETYLVMSLGMPWDQVHGGADWLEHAVSEELVGWMDEALGHPDTDPYGDPVPRNSNTNHSEVVLIAHTIAGTEVRVVRVPDSNPEILRFLAERGIAIRTRLKVLSGLSGTGSMTIGHGEIETEFNAPMAEAIHVAPTN